MRAITLVENLVYDTGLKAEHGLSIYIEIAGKKILFDTGQSGLFALNASILGVSIEDVDILILSHGHYDHSGGLEKFLEINSKATVYAGKGFDDERLKHDGKYIGVPKNILIPKERLVEVTKITIIGEDILIFPAAPVLSDSDFHNRGLYIKRDGVLKPDFFEDEITLAIREFGNGNEPRLNIFSACSHRGITNICRNALEYTKCKPGIIVGGFHLKDESGNVVNEIVNYFSAINPEKLGVGHCTGVEKICDFKRAGVNVFYNYTGTLIQNSGI